MNKRLILALAAFLVMPLFADTCTNEELTTAAKSALPKTKEKMDSVLNVETDHDPKWKLVEDPAPQKLERGKGDTQKDLYVIDMSEDDFSLPVYIWTSHNKCDWKKKKIHLGIDQGDDG